MQTKCKPFSFLFLSRTKYLCTEKQRTMKQIVVIMAACLLLGCKSNSDEPYLLQGAWTLRQVEYPYDRPDTDYKQENTLLRLYDGDSVFYTCLVVKTETGLIVRHSMLNHVTLIDKGGGEYVYLEDGDPRPLTVTDDTTIVIQRNGSLSTWHRDDDIAKEWGEEIRDIVIADLQRADEDDTQSYALSAKERRQANVIHGFVFLNIAAVALTLLIARIAVQTWHRGPATDCQSPDRPFAAGSLCRAILRPSVSAR